MPLYWDQFSLLKKLNKNLNVYAVGVQITFINDGIELQVNEYYALKGEATKRCGVLDMELNKELQEQETEKNNLQFEQRRISQASDRVKNVNFLAYKYGFSV